MWIDKPEPGSQQSSTRLIDYIPRNKNGRVIFTTRDRKVGVKLAHQNVIEVRQMAEDTATRMLRNLLIHKELVDSRPAAYINENGITLADYLTLVDCQEHENIELLTEEFEDDARYSDMKNPVATTWLISF
ncbi:hypothetical protein TPAR_00552 [Tolypocladium paradoxum]|uniref:Uncharacterized protein n=1 Tax=Tolypocladium paradoxum TaxID=94208 RepID=A0A2S4LA06_9HYPO|nr:hypothetical protein TPAR_00552 [Tolypocladium paradoxum]